MKRIFEFIAIIYFAIVFAVCSLLDVGEEIENGL